MRKSGTIKILAACGMAICIFGGLTGCGKSDVSSQELMRAVTEENRAAKSTAEAGNRIWTKNISAWDTEEQAQAEFTGTIIMAGSTSMEKFANALAESFMTKYPGVTVTVEFTGSSAGIESVLAGRTDIGNSSRNLKDDEKDLGAAENIVAIDGIAVITNISNITTTLTIEQLARIYKGEIRNWSEVGGNDKAIVVVGREAGSGTRDAFEELLEIEDVCDYANELDSEGAVKARVAITPGAIGYVSPDVLDHTILTISLDGIEPTEENIKVGSYPLGRPFIMVTNGEISAQSREVQEMFEYLKSEEGQELIRAVGLVVPY